MFIWILVMVLLVNFTLPGYGVDNEVMERIRHSPLYKIHHNDKSQNRHTHKYTYITPDGTIADPNGYTNNHPIQKHGNMYTNITGTGIKTVRVKHKKPKPKKKYGDICFHYGHHFIHVRHSVTDVEDYNTLMKTVMIGRSIVSLVDWNAAYDKDTYGFFMAKIKMFSYGAAKALYPTAPNEAVGRLGRDIYDFLSGLAPIVWNTREELVKYANENCPPEELMYQVIDAYLFENVIRKRLYMTPEEYSVTVDLDRQVFVLSRRFIRDVQAWCRQPEAKDITFQDIDAGNNACDLRKYGREFHEWP